jgi:hypothetical protein
VACVKDAKTIFFLKVLPLYRDGNPTTASQRFARGVQKIFFTFFLQCKIHVFALRSAVSPPKNAGSGHFNQLGVAVVPHRIRPVRERITSCATLYPIGSP